MKEVPLTRGFVALVDDEDYERVAAFNWQARVVRMKTHATVYASRIVRRGDGRRGTVSMHNFILGERHVDHHDRNGLNNQRHNLRACNHSNNHMNMKKRSHVRWKGVHFHKGRQIWRAYITKDGIRRELGGFQTDYDAAQAYNFAAEEMFGEFARFNVVDEPAHILSLEDLDKHLAAHPPAKRYSHRLPGSTT